ncbi:MAG: CcmD family protein [Chloroflexi bacterium]|nr:CcmD family protein [Chloroflexota bacterium]
MPDTATNPLVYLFAAFVVMWAVFFVYSVVLSSRQHRLRKEIEAMKKALAEREKKG